MKKSVVWKILKWTLGSLATLFLVISLLLYLNKDKIIAVVLQEVNSNLKAPVHIHAIDLTFWSTFPNLSVDFEDVFMRDATPNATDKDTLLDAALIRLKFNPFDVWAGNYNIKGITVEHGALNLKVDRRGKTNYDIFKPSKGKSEKPVSFQLKKVFLDDVKFGYFNQATEQTYQFLASNTTLKGNFNDDVYDIQTQAELKILEFTSGKVTLIKNQPAKLNVAIRVDKTDDFVELKDAEFTLAGLPFEISCKVTKEGFNAEIHAKQFNLQDLANSISSDHLSSIAAFKGKGDVYFDLLLSGKTNNDTPVQIACEFGIDNGELTEPVKQIRLSNISLKGIYSNNNPALGEYLKLKQIKFNTPGGPFSGNLLIKHFNSPTYTGNASGNINLQFLQSLFHVEEIEQIEGNVGVNTHFDIGANSQIKTLSGEVDLKNILVQFKHDKRIFKQGKGTIFLKGNTAGIDQVSFQVGKSDLKVDGVFNQLQEYLNQTGTLNATVSIVANYIDVQDLGMTTKEEKISDERSFVLPDDITGDVSLSIGKLVYEEHCFEQLAGQMHYSNRTIEFPNLKLVNAGARLNGQLSIAEKSPEIFTIKTIFDASNIQFKPVFTAWNNFGQDVIKASNIAGTAQARVYFEAPFDLRKPVSLQAIKSQIDLLISDGRLTQVSAFKSITKSLNSGVTKLAIGKENIALLEQKLNDIRFETLQNTLIIADGKLTIPKMDIKNSALNISVSGWHGFDEQIDYRFGFQFRDVKAKKVDAEFGEVADDGTGMAVYLRMYGTLENPKFDWDKQAKQDKLKEDIEAEKETIKSMLKSEFNLFGKDSTIKQYTPAVRQPKEEIIINFEEAQEEEPVTKPKRDSKIDKSLKKLKESAKTGNEEEISIDD